jgi:hypothetical protein
VDHLLPIFSEVYMENQQQKYAAGVAAGMRTRQPGGGAKGKRLTMFDQLLFVLYDYKTYPTFDVRGTQCAMGRSTAHETLHTLSPLLDKTLVRLALMPHRACKTPEAFKAALQGADRCIIDATERAYRRSQDETKQREHASGKQSADAEKHRHVPA